MTHKNKFHEKIKEAELKEKQQDFFIAGSLYKDAITLGRSSSDNVRLAYCKRKMIEMNKKAQKDFKKASFEKRIDTKELEKILNNILKGKELNDILDLIGRDSSFQPKFEEVKREAKETTPLLNLIATTAVFDKKGHVVKGGSDGEKYWLVSTYLLTQDLISSLYLGRIFLKLMRRKKEQKLNYKNLLKYLKDKGIFDEKNLDIIKVGLKRYFSGDYISAQYILIPQFESTFLDLSEKLGLDITKLNDEEEISTENKTLSHWHLEKKEFIEKWGLDFCQQIKYVFFEPLGLKLRHKTAHGEMYSEDCNFRKATLVVYLFLVLASRIKKNNK